MTNINGSGFCTGSRMTASTATAAVRAAAYVVMAMLSILGNVLVVAVVLKNGRLRSVTLNQRIASMAVADLLTSVFNMTIEIWINVENAHGRKIVWFDGLLGVILCKLVVFIQGSSVACSVSILTAIAVNRFFAVFYPLKVVRYSNSLATLTISSIWLVSFAIASPMLYAMKVVETDGVFHCIEKWAPAFDNSSSNKIYTLFLFGFLYVSPLAIITVVYSAIVRKVWRRQVSGIVIVPNRLLEFSTRKGVLRMLITVVVTFGLCWLPYYTYLLLAFVIHQQPDCGPPSNIMFFGLFLGHANSAINPCIYAIFNKEYRSGLLSLHRACLSRISRRPNHSRIRMTQLATEETTREQAGRFLRLTKYLM